MAKKATLVQVELTTDYANKVAGTTLGLNSVLAANLVTKGVAKYSTGPVSEPAANPVKETKIKTSKKKKDEKNNDTDAA